MKNCGKTKKIFQKALNHSILNRVFTIKNYGIYKEKLIVRDLSLN